MIMMILLIAARNIVVAGNLMTTMNSNIPKTASMLKSLDPCHPTTLGEAVTALTRTGIMKADEIETRTRTATMIAKSHRVTDPIGTGTTTAHVVVTETEIVIGTSRIAKSTIGKGTAIETAAANAAETRTTSMAAVPVEEAPRTADRRRRSKSRAPRVRHHEVRRRAVETRAASPAPQLIRTLLSAKPATANAC
jgi:hypothetical protein